MIEAIYKELGVELTRLITRFGYTYSTAKVLAVMLISPKPLSISELKRITGLSIGSVSMALKRLEAEGLVTYVKRGRTKFFHVVRGLSHMIKILISKLLSGDELANIERKGEKLIKSGHEYLRNLLSDIKDLKKILEDQ